MGERLSTKRAHAGRRGPERTVPVSRCTLLILGILVTAGCGGDSELRAPFRIEATDGQTFDGGMFRIGESNMKRNAEANGALASAAHDLPCAREGSRSPM